MHFNTEITFTRIDLKREEDQGRWLPKGVKWSIDHTDINAWQSGEITLNNGQTIPIEEDWDQITKRMDDKRKEKQVYDDYCKLQDNLGMVDIPGAGEDG